MQLTHLVTKKLRDNGLLIHRYFFHAQQRKNLSALVVRVDLLDDAGNQLTQVSLKFPKAKTAVDQFVYVDDVVAHKATQFRYTIVEGLFKKGQPVEGKMVEQYEDLSMYA